MTIKRKDGKIAWERVAAICVVLGFVWPVLQWAVALSSVPEKVDKLDRRMATMERHFGVYDTNNFNYRANR